MRRVPSIFECLAIESPARLRRVKPGNPAGDRDDLDMVPQRVGGVIAQNNGSTNLLNLATGDGPKRTIQTSPRCGASSAMAGRFVGSHGGITRSEILRDDVGPREIVESSNAQPVTQAPTRYEASDRPCVCARAPGSVRARHGRPPAAETHRPSFPAPARERNEDRVLAR